MAKIFQFSYVFFLLFGLNLSVAQQTEFVNGRLIDSKTQEPIPFASIRVKNNSKGLISNFDGGFKIPLELKKIGDTLEISSLGYKSKEVLLSKLSMDTLNTIRLLEDVEALDEVVVTKSKKGKRRSANEIVGLAVSKIPQNFPTVPFSYVGYYRDYQLKDGNYLNLNEAILAIFDPGFGIEDLKGTRTRIYLYKENLDFPKDSIAARPYDYLNRSKIISKATLKGQGGNEYTILRLHDAIRNYNIYTYSFIDRLDRNLVGNHKLRLEEDTFLDDIPLYSIKISKVLDKVEVFGKIYIDKVDFAIYRLEYAVYEKKPLKYRKEPFSNSGILTSEKGGLGKLLFEINEEYQYHRGKMYLNYISFNNAFEILKPPKFIPIAAEIDSDRKRFELILNNPPLENDAVKKEKYKLYYQGRKLNIAKIEVKKNRVLLYPKNEDVVFDPKLVQFFGERATKGVEMEVKGVRDIYGNVVHESESVSYNQYREFFVQQLMLKESAPIDSLYMTKNKPIHGQQIVQPKNLADYWLNTPLKN